MGNALKHFGRYHIGDYLGFTPLPALYWPLLIVSLILYARLTESTRIELGFDLKWAVLMGEAFLGRLA